jgi:hypothetical protein
MGLVKNVEGLIACRVLLGFFEAGIVPGTSFLRPASQYRVSANFCGRLHLLDQHVLQTLRGSVAHVPVLQC